jgi:hypothetical protein
MGAIDPALSAEDMENRVNALHADNDLAHQLPGIAAGPQGQQNMSTLQPNHPDQYRALPPPPTMYPPPYQQPPQMGYPPAQPAPRQRTAIACRYCRRRKVGFFFLFSFFFPFSSRPSFHLTQLSN